MLECSDCGTKNTNGASMCITCGNKRLLIDAAYSVTKQVGLGRSSSNGSCAPSAMFNRI